MFVKYELDIKNRKCVITDDNATVSVPFVQIDLINKDIDKNVYYRNDVICGIEDMIASGDLPDEALSDESYITAVLDYYARLREDDHGYEYAIEEAFSEVSYPVA